MLALHQGRDRGGDPLTALFILMAVIAGGFLLAWVGDLIDAAATRRVQRHVSRAALGEPFDQSVHCRVVDGQ